MAEGEGFQIVTWDVMNPEKSAKRAKKGEDYENSGTVILKSINIDRVSTYQSLIYTLYLLYLAKMTIQWLWKQSEIGCAFN